MTIKNVCVYCSASRHLSERYLQVATDIGKILVDNDWGLVYGGGRAGLMGTVATSVLENKGHAIGIITEYIQAYEDRYDELDELHVVDTMHTRKQMMVDRSDAFVILPGGYGTLDEAFEILKWKQLRLHYKPIVFVNAYGFWDFLKGMEQHFVDEKFLLDDDRNLFVIVDKIENVPTAILAQEAEGLERKGMN